MNYWILQSNPNRFPIREELKHFRTSYWQINPRFHKMLREIESGDTAFIWQSNSYNKEGKCQYDRGIYAIAKILSVSPHHKQPNTPEAVDRYSKENKLDWIKWFDLEESKRREKWPTLMLEYIELLLDSPILVGAIQSIAGLEKLTILKQPQGTVYHLSQDEVKIMKAKLLQRHLP